MPLRDVRKILVPIDFSAHSREAAAWAGDLARCLDARLTLVHVNEPVVFMSDDGNALMNEAAEAAAETELRAGLARIRQEVEADSGRPVDAELLIGAPAAEIVRFATEGRFGMVVMGTHGRTGVKRALLGSVAEAVLRRAPCPVLTVRLGASSPERQETPPGRRSAG
jgi:nucleotide-binding universal stress UspA family protein